MGSTISHLGHTGTDIDLPNDGTPDMADDSVGAATQYVYDATAGTEVALTKMLTQLKKAQSLNDQYISGSSRYAGAFGRMLKTSQFRAQRALSQSELITNGVSDDNSAKMIDHIIKSASKSNNALIDAMKYREHLRTFIGNRNILIRNLGHEISTANLKAFADISIAQKICEGAKMTQQLSKSFVEKAERYHLARAVPEMNAAVKDIQSVMKISSKIFPIKTGDIEQIAPVSMSKHLDAAYRHNKAAVSHAKNALKLFENARVREVISAREDLRSAIGHEQDVLDMIRTNTDREIRQVLAPRLVSVNSTITSKLVPAVTKFNEINRKVLDIIDPNSSIKIGSNIANQSRKILTTKSEIELFILPQDSKGNSFSNFL